MKQIRQRRNPKSKNGETMVWAHNPPLARGGHPVKAAKAQPNSRHLRSHRTPKY